MDNINFKDNIINIKVNANKSNQEEYIMEFINKPDLDSGITHPF